MSAGTWWDQIGAYNNAIFPMQIIIMIIAVVVTHFSFTKPDTKTSNMTKAYLSFTLAWNGIIFFLIFGKELPGTFLGASLCILVAILFAWDIFANKTQFRLPDVQWQRAKCFSYQESLISVYIPPGLPKLVSTFDFSVSAGGG